VGREMCVLASCCRDTVREREELSVAADAGDNSPAGPAGHGEAICMPVCPVRG